ncbi:hypothetical protein [Streptomyces sp. NPDC088733]|uniref:hypothetical protein n=1 Tax=Streptomyces sp. NPDC088733 TaxID=3365880 RepID=UPI00382AF6E2
MTLWPALSDGRRTAWFWWDLDLCEIRASGMATSPVEHALVDGDAVRVHPGGVPPDQVPTYRGYEPGQQPRVQVRVGGRWHDGRVWHTIRYRDGRHAVQVKMTFLEGDDWPVVYWRTYWWNPRAIRVMR